MKLSALLIAKNEEEVIADCLDSISFCDEIVLLDNGSTDRTADIAGRMGARVIKVEESLDFAKLRNKQRDEARGDYVF